MSETSRSGGRRLGPRAVPVAEGSHDVRHAVRRLRWFASSFHREIHRLSHETGLAYRIDDTKLAEAFVAWLRAFKAQRPAAGFDIKDFSCFAAGLMLRELIRHEPLTLSSAPADADAAHPAYFWPEGYAYVDYCMSVCSAVIQQEFGTPLDPSRDFWNVRVWWSFRENVREDTALAVGFFQLFCGIEPNWNLPSVYSMRSHAPFGRVARESGQPLLGSPGEAIG